MAVITTASFIIINICVILQQPADKSSMYRRLLSSTENNFVRFLFHIYVSAGFKHQSTFNRAFKQIENKTPSEYMRSIGIDTYTFS